MDYPNALISRLTVQFKPIVLENLDALYYIDAQCNSSCDYTGVW